MDIASIPGGPLISVIREDAGFHNSQPAKYPESGYARSAGNYKLMILKNGMGLAAKERKERKKQILVSILDPCLHSP